MIIINYENLKGNLIKSLISLEIITQIEQNLVVW